MIRENLEEIREKINNAAKKAGNSPDDITLIAVTKTHGPELINEAIDCGITDILPASPLVTQRRLRMKPSPSSSLQMRPSNSRRSGASTERR